MTILEQKRLIKRFYLISLVLNVIIPFAIAKIIVGNRTGEIQYLYIGAAALSIISIISYAVYFLVPDFESKRDKIATLFFPSILLLGLCIVEFGFIYFLVYTLVINLVFFLIWNRKLKKG